MGDEERLLWSAFSGSDSGRRGSCLRCSSRNVAAIVMADISKFVTSSRTLVMDYLERMIDDLAIRADVGFDRTAWPN
jgi:hypothetical protein